MPLVSMPTCSFGWDFYKGPRPQQADALLYEDALARLWWNSAFTGHADVAHIVCPHNKQHLIVSDYDVQGRILPHEVRPRAAPREWPLEKIDA